ncbi:MAG: 3,4-dihydroxy-2-butanone-4-phosphate synthase [Prolixibacteraceae bacterium]
MDVKKAIDAIKNGQIVIVADDDQRENEGDLIMAAELITKEQVNFMVSEARGLMCVSLTPDRCKELGLDPMVEQNTSTNSTQFTVSVDLIADDVSTGISAYDRMKTIRALVDPTTKPHQLGRPGHIFPLIAHPGGVLERPGHTEAAIQLCQLAGLKAGAVLIEIMNTDGSMSRYDDLIKFSEKHHLELITVKQLQYYLKTSQG